jgi:hypothetical protein
MQFASMKAEDVPFSAPDSVPEWWEERRKLTALPSGFKLGGMRCGSPMACGTWICATFGLAYWVSLATGCGSVAQTFCPCPTYLVDGGPDADAGVVDAGAPDAGGVDAGADAGTVADGGADGGNHADAGADGGSQDAGPVDGGSGESPASCGVDLTPIRQSACTYFAEGTYSDAGISWSSAGGGTAPTPAGYYCATRPWRVLAMCPISGEKQVAIPTGCIESGSTGQNVLVQWAANPPDSGAFDTYATDSASNCCVAPGGWCQVTDDCCTHLLGGLCDPAWHCTN